MEGVVNAGWRGRRILVTGHTGFKGGWLAWWLHRLGARLTGYALAAPTTPSLYAVAHVAASFEREHEADVRDGAALLAAMRASEPEVVFHLAAQPLVPLSYREPVETFSTNVMGTVQLLDAVRRCASVRAVVVVTSDKCYREQQLPQREDDALGGHDPYSASKACAELVTASYRDAYELPQRGTGVATARAGNVIGGGDWTPERLLPDLLGACSAGVPLRLRRPHAVRPWQHVLEPIAGYVMLADKLLADACCYSGAWNLGPDSGSVVPVSAVVDRLQAIAGTRLAVLPQTDAAPHEAPLLLLDASKARAIGWQPRLALDAALDLTWRWHSGWRAGADMRTLTQRQIEDFQ